MTVKQQVQKYDTGNHIECHLVRKTATLPAAGGHRSVNIMHALVKHVTIKAAAPRWILADVKRT